MYLHITVHKAGWNLYLWIHYIETVVCVFECFLVDAILRKLLSARQKVIFLGLSIFFAAIGEVTDRQTDRHIDVSDLNMSRAMLLHWGR